MSRRWTTRRRGTSRRNGNDGGQVVPLAAALVGLCCVALLALAPVARALDDRARARTAADAAALAGAADGERTAREVAAANGADLLEIERTGDEVVVQVRVGEVEAYARARGTRRQVDVGPGGSAGGAGGHRAGLAPAMLAALARADGLLGHPVRVVSGLRSRSQQEALWARRATNPYPVARPGTSDHERGLAIDVPRADVADLRRVAPAAGLCQPLPTTDPIHFIVCGT
jgi:D-alanyl-D-alanine carboxypeptidase/Putative Flp pilus-assembly TadE/G-like